MSFTQVGDAGTSGALPSGAVPFEVMSRIFLPLVANNLEYVPWSEVATRAGIELEFDTTWDSIRQLPGALVDDPRPQQGAVDERTLESIAAVLSTAVQSTRITILLWRIYDELQFSPELELSPVPSSLDDEQWHNGQFLSAQVDLKDLMQFTHNLGRRFPALVVPEHREFELACPGYSDSFFLRSSRAVHAGLVSQGLDVRERLRSGE